MTTGGGFGGEGGDLLYLVADPVARFVESAMPIYPVFSKRMRQQRGELPQVFQTEKMPIELKAHLRRVFFSLVGEANGANWAHEMIGRAIFTEYPHLFKRSDKIIFIPYYILDNLNSDDFLFLDLIDLAVKTRLELKHEKDSFLVPPRGELGSMLEVSRSFSDDISDLNYRFRESGYGYQVEGGELVPIDSTFTHSQIVEPALYLLKSVEFNSALDEFYAAFEDYKRGDYRDCIKKCGDTLDSTVKSIFANMQWTPPGGGNFAPYVREAMKNGLLPSHLETYFNHLAGIIISGVGNLRNKEGGHGKGPDESEAPDYFARYMINMTASTVLLLIHAYQDKVVAKRQG